jgi:hypothetical protein
METNEPTMARNLMNDIADARARVNQRVARYLQSHSHLSYGQIAAEMGVSRWRVLMVAGGLGISRKTGPKNRRETNARSEG